MSNKSKLKILVKSIIATGVLASAIANADSFLKNQVANLNGQLNIGGKQIVDASNSQFFAGVQSMHTNSLQVGPVTVAGSSMDDTAHITQTVNAGQMFGNYNGVSANYKLANDGANISKIAAFNGNTASAEVITAFAAGPVSDLYDLDNQVTSLNGQLNFGGKQFVDVDNKQQFLGVQAMNTNSIQVGTLTGSGSSIDDVKNISQSLNVGPMIGNYNGVDVSYSMSNKGTNNATIIPVNIK